MGLRPTNGDEDACGADPLDPLFGALSISVAGRRGRRPRTRGPPHLVFNGALQQWCGSAIFHAPLRSRLG